MHFFYISPIILLLLFKKYLKLRTKGDQIKLKTLLKILTIIAQNIQRKCTKPFKPQEIWEINVLSALWSDQRGVNSTLDSLEKDKNTTISTLKWCLHLPTPCMLPSMQKPRNRALPPWSNPASKKDSSISHSTRLPGSPISPQDRNRQA